MFDCGNTVASALMRYENDKSNPFAGSTDPLSAGNGGLMRLAPAILAACELDEAVRFAARSTRLTHGADEAIFYSELLAEELWNPFVRAILFRGLWRLIRLLLFRR